MSWRQQGHPELKSLFPFWMGFIPHVANWGIICSYFFYGVSNGSPPAFVWAIIFILFFLDITFAVNQYCKDLDARNLPGPRISNSLKPQVQARGGAQPFYSAAQLNL